MLSLLDVMSFSVANLCASAYTIERGGGGGGNYLRFGTEIVQEMECQHHPQSDTVLVIGINFSEILEALE